MGTKACNYTESPCDANGIRNFLYAQQVSGPENDVARVYVYVYVYVLCMGPVYVYVWVWVWVWVCGGGIHEVKVARVARDR